MDKNDYFQFNPWWEGEKLDTGVKRGLYLNDLEKRLPRKQIEILTGSRRIGKTTLIKQVVELLLDKRIKPQDICYISCDFARAIDVSAGDHLTAFRQIFSHPREKKLYLFFDEIQDSPNWQAELKSIYDLGNVKIFCSGSTSVLISSHGGKLTGRQINTVIYPLTFSEFLEFRKIAVKRSESYLLESEAEKYLQIGGYPENVLQPSDEYLSSLLEDIFARDLARVYPIRQPQVIRGLYKLLAASVGNRISFNKIANILGLNVETVKEYVGYFESSFLVGKLEQWSTSVNKRVYGPKKIYLLDTGMKTLLTGDKDLGFKAEQAVYWKLRRGHEQLGYIYEGHKETDFVWEGGKVEVKYTSDKRRVEESGCLVVTKNLSGKNMVPLWEFLLD